MIFLNKIILVAIGMGMFFQTSFCAVAESKEALLNKFCCCLIDMGEQMIEESIASVCSNDLEAQHELIDALKQVKEKEPVTFAKLIFLYLQSDYKSIKQELERFHPSVVSKITDSMINFVFGGHPERNTRVGSRSDYLGNDTEHVHRQLSQCFADHDEAQVLESIISLKI